MIAPLCKRSNRLNAVIKLAERIKVAQELIVLLRASEIVNRERLLVLHAVTNEVVPVAAILSCSSK